MNASEAISRLRRLELPVVSTADAAAALAQTAFAASKTLGRLAASGVIQQIRHGLFWIDGEPQPYACAPFLTAPFDSYVSLHSALYLHGMIDQVPAVIYVVSQGRSQRVRTTVGTFSVHRVEPAVFGGCHEALAPGSQRPVSLATREKALFDVAYLSAGRSRLFASLPELSLGRGFRVGEVKRWVRRISSARARTLTQRQLDRLLTRSSEQGP